MASPCADRRSASRFRDPDQDRAAAVLALGMVPSNAAVLERMVLDLDREPLFAWDEARALVTRPALEDAVQFKPEIVVQRRASCFWTTDSILPPAPRRPRLGHRSEIALGAILLERHVSPLSAARSASPPEASRLAFSARGFGLIWRFGAAPSSGRSPPGTSEVFRAIVRPSSFALTSSASANS